MKDGDLVLCDVGAKKSNICSDITTTFPVNGKYSKIQKDIYDVVLDAQLTAIKATKPGVNHREISKASNRKIVEGLLKLGLIKGELEELIQKGVDRTFMPHSLSHYIG